jgi:hypothetical protein
MDIIEIFAGEEKITKFQWKEIKNCNLKTLLTKRLKREINYTKVTSNGNELKENTIFLNQQDLIGNEIKFEI